MTQTTQSRIMSAVIEAIQVVNFNTIQVKKNHVSTTIVSVLQYKN